MMAEREKDADRKKFIVSEIRFDVQDDLERCIKMLKRGQRPTPPKKKKDITKGLLI